MPADKKDLLRTAWKLATDVEWPFVTEFRFHPHRLWRFDFAFPEKKLAIEIDGVTYSGPAGRHQRAAGFTADCEKKNAAVEHGWAVLVFTPSMINADPVGVVEQIINVAASREGT